MLIYLFTVPATMRFKVCEVWSTAFLMIVNIVGCILLPIIAALYNFAVYDTKSIGYLWEIVAFLNFLYFSTIVQAKIFTRSFDFKKISFRAEDDTPMVKDGARVPTIIIKKDHIHVLRLREDIFSFSWTLCMTDQFLLHELELAPSSF